MDSLPYDWVISDTHWLHKNINKYCHRTTPAYPTPESVDSLMEYNWKALVKPDDRIIHLGDLCYWGDGRELPMLRELPGRKFLIKGNHDNYPDEWYEDHGFEVVAQHQEAIEFRFHHPLTGVLEVKLSHYAEPLLSKQVCVHGHVHGRGVGMEAGHIDVSVDICHFAPLPLGVVLEKAASRLHYERTRNKRQ